MDVLVEVGKLGSAAKHKHGEDVWRKLLVFLKSVKESETLLNDFVLRRGDTLNVWLRNVVGDGIRTKLPSVSSVLSYSLILFLSLVSRNEKKLANNVNLLLAS